MMYAPLHTVIWEDQHGDALFTVDQPSKHFASFDIPEIIEVRTELDHRLAALLDATAVAVPLSSTDDDQPGPRPGVRQRRAG